MSKKAKLLYKPKVDVNDYDAELPTNNPLYLFRIFEVKQRRHYSFIKKKAAIDKTKLCFTKTEDLDDVLPFVQEHYKKKIREYVKDVPVPRMLKTMDAKIRSYVPQRFRNRYPDAFNRHLADVNYIFDKHMKNYSIRKIIVAPEIEDNDLVLNKKFEFKFFGRTSNYKTFLQNREKIKARLNVTKPYIRAVLNHANLDFPNYLYEFEKFNEKYANEGAQTFNKLIEQVQVKLKKTTLLLRNEWYPKLIKIINKYYKRHGLDLLKWPQRFICMEVLINRELNNLKTRSIEHLIEVMLGKNNVPRLKLDMVFDKKVDLSPNFPQLIEGFNTIIDNIAAIGTQLTPLEIAIDPTRFKARNQFLKIKMSESHILELKRNLAGYLKLTYGKVLEYRDEFQEKYYSLYGAEIQNELMEFLNIPRTFNEYFERVQILRNLIKQLQKELQREHFIVAVVNNVPAINGLRNLANKLIEMITEKIVAWHYEEELQICNIFENIKKAALKFPHSTEELLENGEYMLQLKTKTILEIQARIKDSLRIGGVLVELTELTQKHVQLQIKTINWLSDIVSVFEQNASLHETYKMQFEEHLREVIEKLVNDMEEFIPQIIILDDMVYPSRYREYGILLRNFTDRIVLFDEFVTWINKEEKLFKLPKSNYGMLGVIKDFVIPFASLINLCIRWQRFYKVWMDGPFEYLEPKFVEETTDDFFKEFMKTQKFYRTKVKQDLINNSVCKFKGALEDPDPSKHPLPVRICNQMIQNTKDFRIGVYIVNIMCNSALRPRHWIEMSEIAGFDITPDAGTTLRKIINYNLKEKLEACEIVSIGAVKELQLQIGLAAMIREWDQIEFPTSAYKDTGLSILSNLDDVQALLDDHIIKALSMRGSPFVKPCEAEVRAWYDKLVRANETLAQWTNVQVNYLYLMPIFSSKDIVAQMPEEGRLYNQVDSTYRRAMSMVQKQPSFMETCPAEGLLEAMTEANILLEDITTGVNNYLEKKRLYFPRFFFLSNDEMLEILSETKDPLRVQPHLGKCFEGINKLEFNKALEVLSMYSSDNENIKFLTIISTAAASGSVEKWLLRVQEEMLISVQDELARSYAGYLEKKRSAWVCDWPQMVVLCISQIFWAADVHASLQSRNQSLIRDFFVDLKSNLSEIVTLIRSKSLTNLNRITIRALIVIDVHAKDVVEILIDNHVHDESDFLWLAQLRYYWENGKVPVRIINATIPFANEYLGDSDRLVITPLTDRCYRTLIGAYQLHLNGAPEGPAGTGKTETTKDLAKALAVQCKVFNCSDGLDYKAMGKFFKGLAACGAWACFDEFNRIELEVLSVIAQQILSIVQAVRANVETFIFEGSELPLNPACYVCITMNPGYAGRSELPDNLKVLFRSVAMMVPDYAMIGEISLYSYGFINARSLAVKIVTTYRLCSEQLSSQNHYDYGMRAVKTVLQACGNIKKAFPDENEDILLLRSLLDVNLPKFLSFDIPLFEGIISDLFPGITIPEPDYKLLEDAFYMICEEMNLQPKECFLIKVIQTYEMMIVRHGFMMVGEPFAGKSVTLKVLGRVLGEMKKYNPNAYHQEVQMGIVNPKSITMGQLYGAFDPVSYEWTDGIGATIFRNFASDPCPDRKWLIFDGPVDAVWIENMNTVLDDNKKLCLTSGEIIAMTSQMSMIFEVMDLSQASPATVSRCGMIFMEPSTLGWEVFAESWLNQANQNWVEPGRELIMNLLRWILPPSIDFLHKYCKQLLNPGDFCLYRSTFDIFEMQLNNALEDNPDDYQKFLSTWYQAAAIFSVSWGIGGILTAESRDAFDEMQKSLWNGEYPNHPIPNNIGKIDINLAVEGLFLNQIYVYKQKGSWKSWPDLVKKMSSEESALGTQVPTLDTGRYMNIVELHIKYRKKLLLVGPTGTGKSFYMQNMLMNKLPAETYLPAFVTFTVMVSANQAQDLFISKLIKRKRGIYGPPKGKLCVCFVDDMNMPAKEKYGAQPAIELIRQLFDYKHWYDLKDTSILNIQDMLILSACGLPGGSRQNVYSRFLCHFNIFSINDFSEETLLKIFSNVLLNNLKKTGHQNEVNISVNQIVLATLKMYKLACANLRPTPAKSHYIFNLRDISRLCMGCALLRRESVDNKKIFAKLWYHEAMRVFSDRLISEDDQLWLFKSLNDCVKDVFKERVNDLFEKYLDTNGELKLLNIDKLMFGTYMDLDSSPDEKKYEEIPSLEQFSKIANDSLDELNSGGKSKVNIVLFTYALQHLNKICRMLSISGGSGLLVGIGGSGRQSLTKLAALMCGENIHQPEITKFYGVNEWRDDIKKVLKEAGGLGKDTVFLMTENQFKLPIFLQDIDCLLNLGEVPNIFAIDERQEVLEMVRLAAQGGNRNIDISPLQVFSFFINRCKQKLHIILCFSPIGSTLRTSLRLYGSLVNCCTIDWFQLWPEEALQMVAERYVDSIDVSNELKITLTNAFQYFHTTAIQIGNEFIMQTGRKIYITSASFLELIKSYENLMRKKQTFTLESKMRYIKGLETLQKAAAAVSIMQKDLNALQPKLIIMAENSIKMMKEIEIETISASAAAEQVKKDELVANIQAEAAQALKSDCEKDLALAVPILEDALSALNTLKPNDITLVKSMKNPPETVKLVMAAVCVIKGLAPDRIPDPTTGKKILDYWGPSKKILGEMTFLQSLKDFDKDNIDPEIMKKIRKEYIPHKDFKPEIVAKASSAAEGLCKWIIAMDLYDDVAKVVGPKKERLAEAEKEFADTMELLASKRAMAEALEKKVAQLNEDLDRANSEKMRLENEVEFCKSKLERAETIITNLGGERSRWTEAANNLQIKYDNLPGDILVSCGIIAYLSSLMQPYRVKCTSIWLDKCIELKIPTSDSYSFIDTLGSEIRVQAWNLKGLPRDTFSIANAIIMDNSSRYSLFVDPQAQAKKWIKNMEKANNLRCVKFNQGNYMKIIEKSIENGDPVLIENVLEELEVPLDPILNRNTYIQGGTEYISLGENVIAMSPNFRLYITTNLRNPHYLPETFNKVTIINFALIQQGLEDQLLGIVVAKERPDLQELRENLIAESAANKAALKGLEDNILYTLSSSDKDILENETAIKILDDSKILAIDIKAKQEAAVETEIKIENFRASYKPVAAHASVLYYTITDLPNVDPMYQFSLDWYINLYIYSIENANKSKDLNRRIKFLIAAITFNLYNNVCRAIFEKDKLLFSFILLTKIMKSTNQLNDIQLMHLLTGGTTKKIDKKKPDSIWITDTIWTDVCNLEQIPELIGFVESFITNLSDWKKYYDEIEPQLIPLPIPWQEKTTNLEKILILKSLRPDKVFYAVSDFVRNEMGAQFVIPPPFDIAKSYEDSNCLMPLIFILSAGSDPMSSLLLFAEKVEQFDNFQSISLGQGQGPIAEKLIKEAQLMGTWVCLQNCHLAPSWMPTLEALWESMDINNTNSNFRLWLTSYPSEKFPVSLLQGGVKMTNEPPSGLRQNLLRSYSLEPMSDEKFYTGCPDNETAFSRLLYAVCFFHAVVQERRKFGPLGWNIPYGFNESDFQISVQQLQMLLNQYDVIPFDAISYLTAECNYGGRVTDAWDRRALVTILAGYVNADVVNDFQYTLADGAEYTLCRKAEHKDVVAHIQEYIPNMPPPEVYGLHSNAGIIKDMKTTLNLLDTMLLTIGEAGSSNVDPKEALLASLDSIRVSLPPNFDLDAVSAKYPVDYNESMNTVLVQEMQRFLRLLNVIRSTSNDLIKAIEGIIVMTPELEDISIAIGFKKIPTYWAAFSYPSLKTLGSYISDFVERLNWLQHWYEVGKPSTFWISGFYFTQAFLTAAMQNYARKHKIAIDKLTFDFTVTKESSLDTPPAEGVYVNGVFLEGARWDITTNQLEEQLPKMLVDKVPAIHVMPTLISQLVEGNRYKCPMYKTAERRGTLSTTGHSTNYILPILFSTSKPASHWIKRSVAIICQISN